MTKQTKQTKKQTKTIQELLSTLLIDSAKTSQVEATISRLKAEMDKAVDSRNTLEAKYIDKTLASIALHFKMDGVAYNEINKYMLDSMPLNADNWAFKANGSPVSVSAIKNWKKTKDDELKEQYHLLSKSSIFLQLSRFEAMKGRKFTQGSLGYAVLKRVKNEDGLIVENPLAKRGESDTGNSKVKKVSTKTTETTEETPEAPETTVAPNDGASLLLNITSILDSIEEADYSPKDDKILYHLARAQGLLMVEMIANNS